MCDLPIMNSLHRNHHNTLSWPRSSPVEAATEALRTNLFATTQKHCLPNLPPPKKASLESAVYNVDLHCLLIEVIIVCCLSVLQSVHLRFKWCELRNIICTDNTFFAIVISYTKQYMARSTANLRTGIVFSFLFSGAVNGVQHCARSCILSCKVCHCKFKGWAEVFQWAMLALWFVLDCMGRVERGTGLQHLSVLLWHF